MDLRLYPAVLGGSIRAVASKSDAHRCLIAAALCKTPTEVQLADRSEDLEATLRCIRALGAVVTEADDLITVTPGPVPASPVLDCHESGSTLRFLLPVSAARCDRVTLTGAPGLAARPLSPLREEMESHGIRFEGERLPLTLTGQLMSGTYTLPGNVSSQYITGLLLALPLLDESSKIRLTSALESAGYVRMTLRTLHKFGIEIEERSDGYRIPGGQRYRSPGRIAVEGDWSNSAFWLTAGAISGTCTVTGLDFESVQGDRAIAELLEVLGASIERQPDGITVSPAPLSGIGMDASGVPDLVPIFAAAACTAKGVSRISHASRLRIKESDRLRTVSTMIAALGGHCEELEDGLVITGSPLSGGEVQSHNDHRIAMATAILASRCEGPVILRDAGAVNKSYPRFWEDYKLMGGKFDVL